MAIGQHTCCNKQKVKRGLWSPEEDEKLITSILTYGHGSWSNVPKLAGLQRCGKSCRLRWINYLRPDLRRGSFSPQEASLIIELHKILGNRWAQIAKHLPGRTDNEVKNFWNSSIKKKLVSQGGGSGGGPDHQHIIPHTFVSNPNPNPNHHQGNFYNFNNNANPNHVIIPPAVAAVPRAPHHEQADHHEIVQHNQPQLPLYAAPYQAPMAPLQGFNQNAGGPLQNDHHEQMMQMMMNNINSDFNRGMQINNPPAAVPGQPAASFRVGVPVSAVVPPAAAVPVLPAAAAVQDHHDQQLAAWAMSSGAQFHQNLFNTLKQECFVNYSAGMFSTIMVPPPAAAAASALPNLAHQTIAGPAMTLPEMDDMDDFSHFSPHEVSDHDQIGNGFSSPDDNDRPSDDHQANFSHDLHVPSDHMDYIGSLMSSFPSTSPSSSASSSLSPLSYSQFDDTLASSWD